MKTFLITYKTYDGRIETTTIETSIGGNYAKAEFNEMFTEAEFISMKQIK